MDLDFGVGRFGIYVFLFGWGLYYLRARYRATGFQFPFGLLGYAVAVLLAFVVLEILIASVFPPYRCVVEGTKIATPSGAVPIETLAVGDRVLSVDDEGREVVGRVSRILRAREQEFLFLHFDDGSELAVTEKHPIASRGGWLPAEELAPGDCVRGRGGEVHLTRIDRVTGTVHVYDLSVDDEHNYLAGGILVHNKSFINQLD